VKLINNYDLYKPEQKIKQPKMWTFEVFRDLKKAIFQPWLKLRSRKGWLLMK